MLCEEDDVLVTVAPVLERYGRFADFLGDGSDDSQAWTEAEIKCVY